jgi:Zn-dependent protease with chaperone function
MSRAQERAADRYALATTRNVDAFVTAMKRLSQQNLAEEYPSPVVRWLFIRIRRFASESTPRALLPERGSHAA